jgi:hypothetical protein
VPNQIRYYLYGYIIIGTCRFMHEILKFATILGFQKTPIIALLSLLMTWWGQNEYSCNPERILKTKILCSFGVCYNPMKLCLKLLSVHAFTKCHTLCQASKARWQSEEVCSFNIFLFDNV